MSWNVQNQNEQGITYLPSGNIIIGDAANTPVAVTVTTTTGVTLPTAGAWALNVPQPIAPTSSPTFVNETLTGATLNLSNASSNSIVVTAAAAGVAGASFSLTGAKAGTLNTAGAAATGSNLAFTAGAGGDNSSTGKSGQGGSLTLTAGAAGTPSAGVGSFGGNIVITSGVGSAGTGTNSAGGKSGSVSLLSDNGGASTGSGNAGNSQNITISTGNGGTAVGTGSGGASGDILIRCGSGGVSIGGSNGTGGSITLQAGLDGSATVAGQVIVNRLTNSTSTTTGSFICGGGVGIAKDLWCANVFLPTSGGTPTGLNFYQTITVALTPGGAFATNGPMLNVNFTRIGNMVMCAIPSPGPFNSSSTAAGTYTGIPTQFIPATFGQILYMNTFPNGVNTVGSTQTIAASNVITFYSGSAGIVNWTSGLACNWSAFVMTWPMA